MKKVRDMTEEEIDLEFEKQYKRDYLLEKEREKETRNAQIKWLKIAAIVIGLYVVASIVISVMIRV